MHRDCDCDKCTSHSTIFELLRARGAVDEFSGGYASREAYLEQENDIFSSFLICFGVLPKTSADDFREYIDNDLYTLNAQDNEIDYHENSPTSDATNAGNPSKSSPCSKSTDGIKVYEALALDEDAWSISYELKTDQEEHPQTKFHKKLMRAYTLYGDDDFLTY